jgi:NADH-quinone oxidoreductase subunit I
MGYFLDSLRSLAVTLRGVFREPTTVHYPMEKRERAERYRNTFALVHDEAGDEACVGCLQCEKICPSDVITILAEKKDSPVTGKRRGYAKDFTLDLNACIFCELCVQVCPTDAILMCRVPQEPGFSREDLCLTMDRLYDNEKTMPVTWANATKLMEMQDPKRGQPPPPPKKAAEPKPATAQAAPAKAEATKPAPKVPAAGAPKAATAQEPVSPPKAATAQEPASPPADAAKKPASEEGNTA